MHFMRSIHQPLNPLPEDSTLLVEEDPRLLGKAERNVAFVPRCSIVEHKGTYHWNIALTCNRIYSMRSTPSPPFARKTPNPEQNQGTSLHYISEKTHSASVRSSIGEDILSIQGIKPKVCQRLQLYFAINVNSSLNIKKPGCLVFRDLWPTSWLAWKSLLACQDVLMWWELMATNSYFLEETRHLQACQ